MKDFKEDFILNYFIEILVTDMRTCVIEGFFNFFIYVSVQDNDVNYYEHIKNNHWIRISEKNNVKDVNNPIYDPDGSAGNII